MRRSRIELWGWYFNWHYIHKPQGPPKHLKLGLVGGSIIWHWKYGQTLADRAKPNNAWAFDFFFRRSALMQFCITFVCRQECAHNSGGMHLDQQRLRFEHIAFCLVSQFADVLVIFSQLSRQKKRHQHKILTNMKYGRIVATADQIARIWPDQWVDRLKIFFFDSSPKWNKILELQAFEAAALTRNWLLRQLRLIGLERANRNDIRDCDICNHRS